ncbi:MAG: 50S ribosomal protein L29 [archaeon]|nr:50S ribosomal protein L29 [archaeon]
MNKRIKEIKNMSKEDKDKKLDELKLELIKSHANASKSKNTNIKQIKKSIARILTLKQTK